MAIPILIPLLNPNEPEAAVAALHVSEGQRVAAGDVLCTLETTKSAADLLAEAEGHVVGLRFGIGDTARAGEVFGYLAEQADWKPDGIQPAGKGNTPAESPSPEALPAGLRITRPALELAHRLGLESNRLPVGPLVTETMVREVVGTARHAPSQQHAAFDPTALLVYGGGGHGKALIDLLRALGTVRIVGVIDDGVPAGELVMGVPVLGGKAVLPELYAQGVRLAVNAVGGIGNVAVRMRVFETLAEAGFVCPVAAHPTAVIEPSATLSAGVQVFPLAYVGSEAHVGFGTIINTGAIVSHECQIGDYVNISPGSMLAGRVTIGERALVGMGVTINLNVQIGAGARIGNSATVKADVPAGGVVRSGTIWPAG